MFDYNRTETETSDGCYVIFKPQSLDQLNRFIQFSLVSLLVLFIFIVNSAVIIAICKTKMVTVKRTEKLFIMLCSCDILTGLTSVPLAVSQSLFDLQMSCYTLSVSSFFVMFPILLSAMTTLVISFDRYAVISGGTKYAFLKKNMFTCIVIDIIVSTTWSAMFCYSSIIHNYCWIAVYSVLLAIYLGTILVCNVTINIQIWLMVSKRTWRIPNVKNHCASVRRTIGILVAWSILCYLPIVTSLSLFGSVILYQDKYVPQMRLILFWSLVPTLVNAGMNSFIYVMVNSKVKQFLLSQMELLLQHERPRCASCEQNIVISRCSHIPCNEETCHV